MPAIRATRWIFPFLLLLVTIVVIVITYRHFKGVQAPRHELTLYGNVDLREIQLAFNDQGRIHNLTAVEGQPVHKDQILGTLDARRYQLALESAQAQAQEAKAHLEDLIAGSRTEDIDRLRAELSAAKATLYLRKISYGRIVRLSRQKVSTPQNLDDARAAYQAAAAQCKALKAQLALAIEGPRVITIKAARAAMTAAKAREALARRELEDTQLLAPANGIIRTRILEPGDMASPQQPVYTLALTQPLWVRTYIDEPQLGLVHEGQRAWVSSDSFPGKRFRAWIGFISPTAEFTPKTVETAQLRTSLVYQIRVFVCNSHNQLRLGMPTTVHIQTGVVQSPLASNPCQPITKR